MRKFRNLIESNFRHDCPPKLCFPADYYQSFLAQLSELDEEDKQLVAALLHDLEVETVLGSAPVFHLKRSDARRRQGENETTKWAILLTMSHFTTPIFDYGDSAYAPFLQYQHPFKPFRSSHLMEGMTTISQLSPIHTANLVRLDAFLLSTGMSTSPSRKLEILK